MAVKVTRKKVPQSACCFQDEEPKFGLELSDKDELDAFSMVAYSGKIIKGHWMWGDLAIDVNGLDFGKRIPILDQHDLDKKVGVSKKPEVSGNNVVFPAITLMDNAAAKEVAGNLKKKFPYQASISVKPSRIEELGEGDKAEVNGFTMKGPGTIFRKAVFREASVCVFGYDPRTSATPLSEDSELEVEILSLAEEKKPATKQKRKTNGGNMFDHLKEENPELYKQIMTALSAKDTDITALTTERDGLKDEVGTLTTEVASLTDENKGLSDENKEITKRVIKLEESDAARLALDAKKVCEDKASGIIAASFAEHKIPEKFQKRISKYLDFSAHVKDGILDEVAFAEVVKGEVKSWKTDLGDIGTGPAILGTGGNHIEEADLTEEQAEKTADEMVALAYPKLKKESK